MLNGIWMKLSSNVKMVHNDVIIVNSLYTMWENTNTSLIDGELQRVIVCFIINMWSITQNSQPISKVANTITQNSQPNSKVANTTTHKKRTFDNRFYELFSCVWGACDPCVNIVVDSFVDVFLCFLALVTLLLPFANCQSVIISPL